MCRMEVGSTRSTILHYSAQSLTILAVAYLCALCKNTLEEFCIGTFSGSGLKLTQSISAASERAHWLLVKRDTVRFDDR